MLNKIMKKLLFSLLWLPTAALAQNVGIGTTTPATRLDVKSSGFNVAQFNGPSSFMYVSIMEDDTYRGYWGSYAGNNEDVDFGTYTGNAAGKLHLTIQASPKVTVDAAGNVGIGTTTPNYLLDVANRMRLRQGTINNIFTTPGIWHTDYRDGSDRMFTGMQDSIRWGIFGGGSGGAYGWGFNFNSRTGNVNIGNTTFDTYKLSVTGSDNGLALYNATGSYYGSLTNGNQNLEIQSAYGLNLFPNPTPAKHILLNPPSAFIFSTPGNVGINTSAPNARLHVGGTVYIGTSAGSPATGYQLSVQGKVIAEEVKVQLNAGWPDYVFADGYQLPSLQTLEQFIQQHKHLPNIPPAAEMEKNGLELGEMQRRTIEKVEELTLLLIQLGKEKLELKKTVESMRQKLDSLEKIK
jgi:hypothetical protein